MKQYLVLALVAGIASTYATEALARGGSRGSSGSHSYSAPRSYSPPSGTGGSHSTHGYTRRDGTYVAPYRATNPNGTKADNYSTRGNVNPYTGKPGTKAP
jgi:uncharacterized membrane protein